MIDRGMGPHISGRRQATFKDWLGGNVEILVWIPILGLMWLLDLRVF